jgi:hypothetical protein
LLRYFNENGRSDGFENCPLQGIRKEHSMFELSGLGGLILLALDLWALISIFGSRESTGTKVLWSLLVIVLPLLGFLIWLIAGPGRASGSRI